MYTEREKIRFVERMWAEGLTPRGAQRKWGRPSNMSLSKWLKEAERGELAAERPKNYGQTTHIKHGHYPQKTIDEAVRLYNQGEKAAHIANRLGITNSAIISVWARKARKNARVDLSKTKSSTKAERREDGSLVKNRVDEPTASELKALKEELEDALFEVAVYKEMMINPKVDCLANLSRRQQVELGEKLRQDYGYCLDRMLTFFRISKSTYHYYRKKMISEDGDTATRLDSAISESFANSKCTYGYRRICADLARKGIRAPERKVRQAMRRLGLVARCARTQKKWHSYEGEISSAPQNLLLTKHKRHNFHADRPNVIWLTDITEMKARDGKLYLSAIIDCFDGKAVAWEMSTIPDAVLVNNTLKKALATLQPYEHPIIHSDRGAHYRWDGWIQLCEDAKLTRSMSRKGHSPDNAACEGFFGRAKTEHISMLIEQSLKIIDLQRAVDDYLTWYNEVRLKMFRDSANQILYESIAEHRTRLGLVA